jgi:hypothetical protein
VLKLYSPAIRSGKFVIEKRYDSQDVIRGWMLTERPTSLYSLAPRSTLNGLSVPGVLPLLHLIRETSDRISNPEFVGYAVLVEHTLNLKELTCVRICRGNDNNKFPIKISSCGTPSI